MFDDFEHHRVETSEAEIDLVRGGEGPPVLLLHGYPQTKAIWHRVAPLLTGNFAVVAADLRGYGDSSKPPGDEGHHRYSKRAMAKDMVEAMTSLGHGRFSVAGHDRGGRVAHRMALDHPNSVERVAVLDIVPTRHVFGAADRHLAMAYYHWFFLAQPFDLPETMIGADPVYFLRKKLASWGGSLDVFAPEALAEYERCFDPATIHASCEDYRAAASIDLAHDDGDRAWDHAVEQPLLALWGARGIVEKLYDVLDVWRGYARDVRGSALDTGHFLPEEGPEETAEELRRFFEEEQR